MPVGANRKIKTSVATTTAAVNRMGCRFFIAGDALNGRSVEWFNWRLRRALVNPLTTLARFRSPNRAPSIHQLPPGAVATKRDIEGKVFGSAALARADEGLDENRVLPGVRTAAPLVKASYRSNAEAVFPSPALLKRFSTFSAKSGRLGPSAAIHQRLPGSTWRRKFFHATASAAAGQCASPRK